MSNELFMPAGTLASGGSPGAIVWGQNRTQRWNGSALVASSTIASSSWSTGVVGLTEQSTSTPNGTARYVGNFPSGITAPGEYEIEYFPTMTPTYNTLPVGASTVPWDGFEMVSVAQITTYALAPDLAAAMRPWLVVAGSLTPNVAENFRFVKIYNGTLAFYGYASGYFCWFNGSNWIISSALGSNGASYWVGGSNSAGSYTWSGSASGTATVTSHGNAELTGYQPNISPATQAQITGGAYALQADGSGYMKLSSGTGTGQITLSGGNVKATDTSGAALATQAQVAALDNNTSTKLAIPDTLVIPSSGTTTYIAGFLVQGDSGQLIAPDSLPTVAVADELGNNLSPNLGSVTLIATGQYKVTYAVASTATNAQVRWTITYAVSSAPYTAEFASTLVPYEPATVTLATSQPYYAPATASALATLQSTANGLATSSSVSTLQSTANTINVNVGSAGAGLTALPPVTLATSQPDYAPATATALASLATQVGTAGSGLTALPAVTLAASQTNYTPATAAALSSLATQVGTAGSGLTALGDTRIQAIKNLLLADRHIDQGTNPYDLVLIQQGTGPIGTGTELLRQSLTNTTNSPITDLTTTVVHAVVT